MSEGLAKDKRIMVLVERPDSGAELPDRVARGGYQVTTVRSREDAVKMLRRRHHDAVILDVDLQGGAEPTRTLVQKLRRVCPSQQPNDCPNNSSIPSPPEIHVETPHSAVGNIPRPVQ